MARSFIGGCTTANYQGLSGLVRGHHNDSIGEAELGWKQ